MTLASSHLRGAPIRDANEPRVAVLIPLALPAAYDYRIPAGIAVAPGDYVRVPLGNRDLYGVVWGPGRHDVEPERLKPVLRRCEVPPMPEVNRRFVEWVASYTL